MQKDEGQIKLATAQEKWTLIPETYRYRITKNVWCGHCGGSVEIVNYQVSLVGQDILLSGWCADCSANVARLVEQEGSRFRI